MQISPAAADGRKTSRRLRMYQALMEKDREDERETARSLHAA
jgi:hypothetical protein